MLPSHSNSAGRDKNENDSKILLKGWDGTGLPEFTEDTICFNGDAETNNDHETFRIDRNSEKQARAEGSKEELVFNFCKTARKPYDFFVCVSLLRLKHFFPECQISSDGNTSDWKPAKDFYKKVFKEAAPKIKL